MNVVILVAGYGTRLYPLTYNIAKPLLPINGKPILNFITDKIKDFPARYKPKRLVVVANNKFYRSFLTWDRKYKIKSKVINDGSNSPDDRKGAIKDIKLGIKNVKEDWLVVGGDNLFEDDLKNFIKFAYKNRPYPTIALYDVKSKKEATRFGIVRLNSLKRIVEFQEKPKKPKSTLAASCVYFFPKQSLKLLNEYLTTQKHLDHSGRYIAWLAQKTKVFGYTLKGRWLDIGHFDSLKLAKKLFKG